MLSRFVAPNSACQRVSRRALGLVRCVATQRSWVEHSPDSDFPIQNLPFGVFSCQRGGARCATAIGDQAVDLAALADAGLLAQLPFDARSVFRRPNLNAFMSLSRPAWRATRTRLTELLSADGDGSLKGNAELRAAAMRPLSEVTMHLPAEIGDYTDFYSSREHATNVGIMFRGKDNALQPNWLHLPVGYHGRASSVVVSGTPLCRPRGQLQADKDDPMKGSVYGASKLLDIELEIGMFVGGKPPPLGRPISIQEAEEYIFGLVVMNDWSSRDIQKWEYVPLGPFGAKNFGTTISPWVVTLDALEPYRCETSAGTQNDPVPLEYLQDPQYDSYDVKLLVDHIKEDGVTTTISKSNFRHMYWNVKQQLVHHAVTGCNMRAGDMLGSGTISGTEPGSYGSMLELTWAGRDEIKLSDGDTRKFLKDGDTINIRGFCGGDGKSRIGFGDCSGKILPAGSYDGVAAKSADDAAPIAYRDFVLRSYWRSTCSWRVRIALAHFGIPYKTIPVNLLKGEQSADGFRADGNSLGQVPVLGFTDGAGNTHNLTQSLVIVDFLDTACAAFAPPLVPSASTPENALRRAQALEIAQVINSGTQPLQNLGVLQSIKSAVDSDTGAEVDGRGFAAAAIRRGLVACEKLVAVSSGTYAVGNEESIADLCIVPQLYNARRFEIDLTPFPNLLRVEAECSKLPAFQAAHPTSQPDAVAN